MHIRGNDKIQFTGKSTIVLEISEEDENEKCCNTINKLLYGNIHLIIDSD